VRYHPCQCFAGVAPIGGWIRAGKGVAIHVFFSYNDNCLLPLDQVVKREVGEAGTSLVAGL
jgi:hypothetical protein